ncbi:MAG TPA: hypothetical protein VHB99_03855, partial [Pirellulales bacterium]|nr:hypothetical protein [Pirellulales bacterium]
MSWVNPAGGAWDVASNWSTGAVPGPADDVTIDTVAAITITSQFSAISVNSLTTAANDALSFSYGNSLTVAGASTLNGSLAMIGGSLTASGPAASLTANGPTTMSGTNLFAKNGGVLSLPQLPSAGVDLNSINASGVGSVVDLSALTGLAQTGSLSVVAAQGGKIKLGGLASLSLDDDNNLTLEADGSGSLLDLSGLTSLAETKSGFAIVGQWNISASHAGEINLSSLQSLSRAQVASYSNLISLNDTTGGEILDGELASLNGVDAILDGTDVQAADSWTSFTSGSLFLTAGTYALPGLSDIDRSSVIVQNGASLSLPGVTSYAPSSRLTFGTPIEVDGAASVLDLPALSSVSISNQPMETLVLKATNGGKLSLAALKSLSAPGVEPRGVQIVDTGASTLLTPLLTSLNGVGVTFDGSDPQAADSWTQFVGGSLKLTGGAFSLPGLT